MFNASLPMLPFAQMTTIPAWINTMVEASTKAVTLAVTSQQVIATRLTMLATTADPSKNTREIERMFSEKVDAVNESSSVLFKLAGTMAQAWPTMFVDPKAAERMLNDAATASNNALTPFSRRVKANQKRLSR